MFIEQDDIISIFSMHTIVIITQAYARTCLYFNLKRKLTTIPTHNLGPCHQAA